MTDETEEDLEEYVVAQTEVAAGSFVILDTDAFVEAMGCLAIQLTEDGNLYLLDSKTLKLRPIELDDGKSKPKLRALNN